MGEEPLLLFSLKLNIQEGNKWKDQRGRESRRWSLPFFLSPYMEGTQKGPE